MAHWQQTMPDRLAELPNPEAFFTRLGEDISQAIEELGRQLAGPAPAQETYLQRLRRLNMARVEAESQVLRRMVLLAQPPTPEP
jgi:hypothetical protein